MTSVIGGYLLLASPLERDCKSSHESDQKRPLTNSGFPLDVRFVGDDDEGEKLRIFDVGVVKEFFAPHWNIFEALDVVDGESQEANVRSAVKRSPQTPKTLLTSGVPNLLGKSY